MSSADLSSIQHRPPPCRQASLPPEVSVSPRHRRDTADARRPITFRDSILSLNYSIGDLVHFCDRSVTPDSSFHVREQLFVSAEEREIAAPSLNTPLNARNLFYIMRKRSTTSMRIARTCLTPEPSGSARYHTHTELMYANLCCDQTKRIITIFGSVFI